MSFDTDTTVLGPWAKLFGRAGIQMPVLQARIAIDNSLARLLLEQRIERAIMRSTTQPARSSRLTE